ncbi:hypothetical protein [Arthrobacter rhombi]|uniref:hypothetical protein n=1 Tax=Arthrobacter rhombi TaxID=71253 RepID=UPI003FD138B9
MAIVLVAGLVVGVSMFYAKSRKDEATAPAPSSAPAAASGADGCIAGRDNDAKSLIEGAKKQAHTEDGAAATAAGFMRFTYRYPWASQADMTSAFAALSIAKDPKDAAEAAKTARSAPGPESANTAGMSFADARYVIEPESTPNKVQVTIASQTVTDGTLNGNSVSMTLTMNWDDGVWKFADLVDEPSTEDILSTGTAFVGGC